MGEYGAQIGNGDRNGNGANFTNVNATLASFALSTMLGAIWEGTIFDRTDMAYATMGTVFAYITPDMLANNDTCQ